MTKDELYSEIKRIYNITRIMNTKIFKENCNIPLSVNYAFHKYGGLQKICDELNIPFSRTNELDINVLKDDIMRVYQEQGKMTVEIYQKYGQYSSSCIKHHFGGFNKMLEQLNLPINTYKNVTKDDVINDIKNFYDKYNTTSNSKYRLYGKYSESTIKNLFGSWENLMNEMKLPYLGQTYGQDEIIRQVRRVYDKYGYISKVLINEECSFTYQALQHYFKNKEQISQALGVDNAFCNTLSSKADLIYNILLIMFGKENIIKEYTWDWLINPKTNHHLYVDFYIKNINLCIEFDGEQHNQFTQLFHKTEQNFLESQQRDKFKEQMLKEHKIKLIRIPYNAKISIKYLNLLILDTIIVKE